MDAVEVLEILTSAYEQPVPSTGKRERIDMFKMLGGERFQHHALDGEVLDFLDQDQLEDLADDGLVDLNYGNSIVRIKPTKLAYEVVEAHQRVSTESATADLDPLFAALDDQLNSENRSAWSSISPVLSKIIDYWQGSNCPPTGVATPAILNAADDACLDLLLSDLRLLIDGGYLAANSNLEVNGVPAEVCVTEKALTTFHSWPGVSSEAWIESLLAELGNSIEAEDDPVNRRRLQNLVDAIKAVGTQVVAEVAAKSIVGSV